MSDTDISRLRAEYADRTRKFSGSGLYSWFNDSNLFIIQQRQRKLLHILKNKGIVNFAKCSILEMGCGSGGVLLEFLAFGADPCRMFGIDLLFDRLQVAHHRLPSCGLSNADGEYLPFPDHTFDLVFQFTALSSILDEKIRKKIAGDMLRILKPTGLILSYDFWLNPTNKQTHGIRPAEVRSLFPGCFYEFYKINLAPPLARRIVPISWAFSIFLESLKIFNSHYLAAIYPKTMDKSE